MARLICCDTCKLAAPAELGETLVDWLTVTVENAPEEEISTWNFCSWVCLGEFSKQEVKTIVENLADVASPA